jgi:hypothetical protein
MERREFWTVESPLSRSIETFVREAPSDITAAQLLTTLGSNFSMYPGNTICNYSSAGYFGRMLRARFEICEVSASEPLRRINLKWTIRQKRSRWVTANEVSLRLWQQDRRLWQNLGETRARFGDSGRKAIGDGIGLADFISIPLENIPVSGLESVGGFVSSGERYLIPGQDTAVFLASLWRHADDVNAIRKLVGYLIIMDLVIADKPSVPYPSAEMIWQYFDRAQMPFFKQYLTGVDKFVTAMMASKSGVFYQFAWDRSNG